MASAHATTLKEKRVVLSSAELQRTIERLAQQIIEPHGASDDLILIGIRKGGENFARRIHAQIKARTGVTLALGFLNVTIYRDDDAARDMPDSQIAVDVAGKEVVVVDDVLYTGRTVRSALDAITDLGRPRVARLCVLVDRGLRELPIQPDYVGRFVPTSRAEHVEVHLGREQGDTDRVTIYERT
ncbi:MAG TPA: bifunctional pyr operon transcriptional regulator/uracil phosphoribosyltransferase PyrR [Candidatus Eremiobacteraceae bacterium]|nr:bifunctional pyr operon transcriptional regulator/uracil phosphoribosyltransferase PyrR [Candidatus Eremiobacteraceae bacterium]